MLTTYTLSMHGMSFPHLYLALPAFGPCTNIQSWGVRSKKDRKQALSMFLGGWVMATNDPNGGYGGHPAMQLRLRWAQFLDMSRMFNITVGGWGVLMILRVKGG